MMPRRQDVTEGIAFCVVFGVCFVDGRSTVYFYLKLPWLHVRWYTGHHRFIQGYNQSQNNYNRGGGQYQGGYGGEQRTYGNYGGGNQRQNQDRFHWKGGQQSAGGGGQGQAGSAKSVSFQNSFGANQNRFSALDPGGGGATQKTEGQDLKPLEILDIIKKDIEEWEGTKMWPLSCYKPNRSQHCIPGFEDITQDELRFVAYCAVKQQKFEIYKTAIMELMNTVQQQKNQLKTPDNALSTQLVDIFKGIYQAGSSTSLGNGDSMFQALAKACGADTSHPPATASAQQGTAFGAGTTPSAPTPGMGITPSTTSTPATNTGFGSAATVGAAPTGFGTAAPGSAFGTTPVPSGLFGKGGTTQASAPPPTGLFGTGGSTQVSAPPPTGLFGKGVATNSATPAAAPGTGLFGKPAATGGGLFNQGQSAQAMDSSIYTPIGELTQEEKEQFEADVFTIGKIPTRPPPVELTR